MCDRRFITRPALRFGFSLAELIVVVGLIGLLLSLSLAGIVSARRSAKAVVCASNLRQIGVHFQNYANRFGGYIPRSAVGWGASVPVTHLTPFPWTIVSIEGPIPPYADEEAFERLAREDPVWHCPEDTAPDMPTSFVSNAVALVEPPTFEYPPLISRVALMSRVTAIKNSSQVIHLADGVDIRSPWGGLDYTDRERRDNFYFLWSRNMTHPSGLPYGRGRMVADSRHGPDRINVLMFDGSVHLKRASELTIWDFDDGVRESRLRYSSRLVTNGTGGMTYVPIVP